MAVGLNQPTAGRVHENCPQAGRRDIPPREAAGRKEWYAVHVRNRHEKLVADQLAKLGVEYFLPLVRLKKRWSDRLATVDEPLFPGYLFTRIVVDESVLISRRRGVVRIVGSGRRPYPVAPGEIEAVRAAIEGGLKCDLWPCLVAGSEVEVVRGPLKGFRGILVRKDHSHRLVLSVRLIAQSVAVEVGPADVRPA